ncbi:WecB/TagA/CpsF family glycosyltransferase [Leucothrix pacifica]|uniref:Glycosyltransferase n=1 Tax=Leucothrix pacifica TaxID=1247513 RepID=A0A317CAZ0_9GAMM|nr:WecB/TagA/CpsF family glycosyltransferase [Leucothrix pacifica]PWQ95794.1 glycosyltransferase [Leucothrix pacifica]
MKRKIWNIGFSEISKESVLTELDQHIEHSSSCKSIAFVNPHSQVTAQKKPELLNKINQFDYVLCDGIGTELAAKLFRKYNIKRLSGPTFFKLLSKSLNRENNEVSYFFLGSTDYVLAKIQNNMHKHYPNVSVVGTYSPPMGSFTDQENASIIRRINQSNCTVLWVGMTAPKQEEWIADNLSLINAKVAAGIGAEFDYFAETKVRPPQWISVMGLQWLHRLVTQPKTWQRTVLSTPIYITNVLRYWFKTKGAGDNLKES